MSNSTKNSIRLRGGTALHAMALLGAGFFAAPLYAQDAAPTEQVEEPQVATEEESGEDIIVTGSILRQTDRETASPVTVLSAESLSQRGINTASEAVQRLSANGAGTIAAGWNTGSNFAAGATAPALRGLTVQNTLSIVDGLRIAPYPLADDGQRNFVDLNSIPNAIVERIEVLRDGASSTYGADAIAGVVNVITKKEVQGVHANASAGIADRGDGAEQRLDLTAGYGDLDEQGFNVYVSGEYQKQEALFARDRDYPFNTGDLTGVCSDDGSTCLSNHNQNGFTPESGAFNGLFGTPGVTIVRPVAADAGIGAGRFIYLNPALGCGDFPLNPNTGTSLSAPEIGACEVDLQNRYQMLQPEIERYGVTARATVNLGENAQFYAMGTYYQTNTLATLSPAQFRNQPAASPGNVAPSVYNVLLPVYVCAGGVGTPSGEGTGCGADNGTLNPYNPFAAEGLRAQALLASPFQRTDETKTRALRGVAGLDGSFGGDWRYNVNFTISEVRLRRYQEGYLIPQRIMDLAATGEFNFADPAANSDAVWDYLAPLSVTTSYAQLWQAQGSIAKDLFQLPGGPLQAAVGVAYRRESIDSPSANPANDTAPFDRYYSINAVGANGSRNVKSAFFELQAPIIDEVEITASGRYDDYSTGQENFSPKVGVKIKPIPEVVVRGTFSKGFRIPSFNEAFGLPTTGYVTSNIDCETYVEFCAAHGGPDAPYVDGSYSIGLTSIGNPELRPEKSTSFTAGVVLEPLRNVAFSVDFWHIKIEDLIVGVTDISPFVNAYYSNNGVVDIPGTIVTPGVPSTDNPGALPLLGFIRAPFQNANEQTVSGIDFAINANYELSDNLTWTSQLDASYMLKYEVRDGDNILRYEDTLSPCNITSCSGQPEWRATWQNTLAVGDTALTLTAYYTKGVDTAQADYGMTKGECEENVSFGLITWEDGTPAQCRTDDIWNVDFSLTQKVNDNFSIYANVLNVFDIKPPLDFNAAYGIFQYNPAFAGPNIMGRFIRVGVKVDL